MNNRPEGAARAARNERREAARQRAQRARTQQKRRQRGVRLGLQIGLGVVLLAAATIVTLVLVDSVKPAGPGPSTMSQGGITIGQDLKPVEASASGSASASPSSAATDGAGTVRITLYVDYLCPGCGQFEQANGDYIKDLVDSGAATVDIHPVAVLSNRSQGTKYSLRAANAAACVAEHSPNQFYAVNQALFAKQPDEGTPGLTDAELTDVVTGVQGLQERSAVRSCIADQDYAKWVDEQTTAVSDGTIPGSTLKEFPGTPLVLVNGQRYELTSPVTNDDFRTFVVTAAGATDATPTPTPSATPTPTPTKR
ncbi:DsbA family protein [Curtobacterium flaccumfaciens]|jgi:protein-disulfide isomerase|uniref:DsbA family protein n=1 Tax=Curtobacterium flaccumfaciens TaxID=2035 RepID=UPI001366E417|nr:thioredoxin domain-containing protein [Curtobacterium flaccumfaciens]MBT1665211.1 thioredoxin domain-containing protein [Curtobacterium flaccumfaciens pv. flaccumfaciens]QFS79016.2 thioredoxin domain-containing protein [Curtobacterium flaccumfaciens pv. flaccumfaciens]